MLGATDFGIFSVVAGSLSALLFINGALTGGAQRHIAYALGAGKTDEAAQWFNASLVIHSALAVGLLLIALWSSHWIIYGLLSLPPARLEAAMWTYRAVIVTVCCTIIATPYHALLMAQEMIAALSLMAMAGSILLVVGVGLLKFLSGDHLIWYSAINAISDGVLFAGPALFCLVYCSECRQLSRDALNWGKIRELLGFSSWNLLGALAVQVRYQGPAVLLNRFSGTTANAANGIAMQVNGFATSVSTGLLSATSPSVVKAEASGDRTEMLSFSNLSNKYAFMLLWLLVGPLLFELKYCLDLWLHQMPPDTASFSCALLIALLVDMLTAGFTAAIQAEGHIALYQGVIGFLICISVPIGYLLLHSHMPARSILWAGVGASSLAGAGRLWFLCNRIGLKARQWLTGVLRPCLTTCVACCLPMGLVAVALEPGPVRLTCLYLLNSCITAVLVWTFATSDRERRLRGSYVSILQERTFSGGRRLLALATRKA